MNDSRLGGWDQNRWKHIVLPMLYGNRYYYNVQRTWNGYYFLYFRKKIGKFFVLAKKKKNIPHVTSYSCKSDAEKIGQVFSVHHFDLIVYDLRGNLEIKSMLSLEQMLQFAASHNCGKILLLSSANVFNMNQKEATEQTTVQPGHEEGRYLMRLEALSLSWKKQGLPITILRFPDMYGL